MHVLTYRPQSRWGPARWGAACAGFGLALALGGTPLWAQTSPLGATSTPLPTWMQGGPSTTGSATSGGSAPIAAAGSPKTSAVVATPQVRAELLAHAPRGIGPGLPLWLGLQITHQPEWHTYWKNPGDSGLATDLRWTLPPGTRAGDIDWPVPHKLPLGTLANFGYEGTLLLPVPIRIQSLPPGATQLAVRLSASWLVCRKECIPEEGEFALQLPLGGSIAAHGDAFAASWAKRPAAITLATTDALQVQADALTLKLSNLPAALRGKSLTVLPEISALSPPAAATEQSWNGPVWTARLPLDAQRSASPERVAFVLTAQTDPHAPLPRLGQGEQQAVGWRVDLPVAGGAAVWPKTAAVASVSPALQAALDANAQSSRSVVAPAPPSAPLAGATWLAALFGALLGGLILNLMPCVLPVLAIKATSLSKMQHSAASARAQGLAFAAGVVGSMLALGGLLLALRAAGEQVGWGFQLQQPGVVLALALLFALIALHFSGLFEGRQWLPAGLANLRARHPLADEALSGALVVAVASPCTAPFMGAALGLAITWPAPAALAIFASLGLGLALPFAAVAWVPALRSWLPRPGAWMLTLQRALAFPMWATVVWLLWVLGQQTSLDAVAAALLLIVSGAALAWGWMQAGRSRWVISTLAVLAVAASAGLLWPRLQAPLTAAELGGQTPSTAQLASGELRWQPWSEHAVAQHTGAGRTVFVDYTAAWCITCQFNKQTVLESAAVQQAFAQARVVTLRADWTRRDPAITQALTALGRTGVPVYVVHRPGQAPQVLGEILSESAVTAAIKGL